MIFALNEAPDVNWGKIILGPQYTVSWVLENLVGYSAILLP